MLDAPAGALVVVDRGIATEAAISWLRENHYRYLVVSRERHRQFDADAAVSIQTQSKQTVQLHKVVATDPDEVRLYCYSEERAEKERGEQVWQRIGRLKARHTRVAAHYAGQRHRRRDRQPSRRRHLDPPPAGRLDAHPSRRLLPGDDHDGGTLRIRNGTLSTMPRRMSDQR